MKKIIIFLICKSVVINLLSLITVNIFLFTMFTYAQIKYLVEWFYKQNALTLKSFSYFFQILC